MADNQTQSSSSPPKRPLTDSSTALPDAKRSKTAEVNDSTASNEVKAVAEAQVVKEPEAVKEEWSPINNIESNSDTDSEKVNHGPLCDPWGKFVSQNPEHYPDIVMDRYSFSVGRSLRCDLSVEQPTRALSKVLCVIKRNDDNKSGEFRYVEVEVTGNRGFVLVNGEIWSKYLTAHMYDGHKLQLDFGPTDKRTYIFEQILPPTVSAASTSEASTDEDTAPAPAPAVD